MKKKVFLQQSKTDTNTFVVVNEENATHYRFEDDENAELSNNAEFLPLPTMNFAKDSKLEATNPVRFPNESCDVEFLPLPKQNFSGQADAASQNKVGALRLPKMF
jgi:hypothetical protein